MKDQAPNDLKEGEPHTVLTSVLSLCAGAHPPTLMDAVNMPIAFETTSPSRCSGYTWPTITIDDELLLDAFHGVKISQGPTGKYATDEKVIKTNGAAVYRYMMGRPAPFVSGELKNQFSDYEMAELAQLNLAGTLAEMQIRCFGNTWLELVKVLDKSNHHEFGSRYSSVRIHRQKFSRIEFYREYPIRSDLSDLHSRLREHLGANYGAIKREYDWIGPRQKNGDGLCYKMKSPTALRAYALRKSEVNLKLYRKDNRLRVEVAFLNFDIGRPELFPASAYEERARKIADAITDSAQLFLKEAEIILDGLHQNLLKRSYRADPAKLIRHLKEKLRLRGVETDKRIDAMINDLCLKGSYTPSQHHKDQRLKGRPLQKLTDPEYGILQEVAEFGRGDCKSYCLKKDWEASPELPREGKQPEDGKKPNCDLPIKTIHAVLKVGRILPMSKDHTESDHLDEENPQDRSHPGPCSQTSGNQGSLV